MLHNRFCTLTRGYIFNERNINAWKQSPSIRSSSSVCTPFAPGKITPIVDPTMQTRELPDGSRVSQFIKADEFMRFSFEDAKTMYETIRRGARIANGGAMLGYRRKQLDGSEPYHWLTYNEVIERSENVAHAFRRLGLETGQGTFIGIFSRNCPEWIITEHAAYMFSNVIVPLYETLGIETSAFIINHTEIALVVCDTQTKVKSLLTNIHNCPTLKHIVCIESNLSSELRALADKVGINLYTFSELNRLGHEWNRKNAATPPKPENLATICYTSGTTGTPKGVMLTHANIIADATIAEYLNYGDYTNEDSMFSFLPMAHMMERVIQATVILKGGRIGFYRGDVHKLLEDIQELKPSIMPVVPRVLNRVHHEVMKTVNKSALKKFVFNAAIKYKSRHLQQWEIRNDTWADKLVFKKIRNLFGGQLKFMVTGSAPLSREVLNFYRCALGCIVVEGYGLTEAVAAATITIEGDPSAGHVGIPAPCNAVKLVDVPELGYFTREGKGEVCIKGNNIFEGYYKNEEQTSATLDDDGWLHTGDIGTWTDFGTLKIIDRKKHIFKLSQGEYIAPEKIENAYVRSHFATQVYVHGEFLKSCLVAIVVPDLTLLQIEAAHQLGIIGRSGEELCNEPRVKDMVFHEMLAVGRRLGLNGFEQVKDIYLCPEPFTVENELLTPTMKSKRPKMKEHFKKEIEEMYSKLEHLENQCT